jgi:cation transport regulator ChaC
MAPAGVSGVAIFAYGSLVDPASASQTLGRPVAIAGRARVEGWRRGWTVARDNLSSEKTFARADGTLPRFILSLDIRPDPDSPPANGALIEVGAAELDRLDLRELRHRRLDVTDAVRTSEGLEPYERVYAYGARPEHHRPTPPPDSIVIAAYLAAVEAAFDALGPGELDEFRATTAPPPVPVAQATLVRDRIPAGNPRAW